MIVDQSTLRRADIAATLYASEELIPELLLDKYKVQLRPLGILSLSFISKAENDTGKINADSIKDILLLFRHNVNIK